MFVVRPSINVNGCLDKCLRRNKSDRSGTRDIGMCRIQTHHGFGHVDGVGLCIFGGDGVNRRLVANAGSLCDAEPGQLIVLRR